MQVGRLSELDAFHAEPRQHAFVLGEGALHRKDPDAFGTHHRPRSSMMSSISSALMPTMASPRPDESSAISLASS